MSDERPTARFQPNERDDVANRGNDVSQGTLIGTYKILAELGEGGCGVVYLAERSKPVRGRVALKVIKPGMDSRQVIARFEAERQALALMDHPNVARVLDAGVSEQGRPYFVMEYVKGIPITEHCDRQKLSIKQRLELFIDTCAAVQHAHQKGIIHRDLKPSNILVSIHGNQTIPKVIDFGVAKAMLQPLTERTLYTEQGQLIGTPEYMSPEQAEMTNQDIDTRTDVYSLGVVLYELLTGSLPFDKEYLRAGGFDHIRRVIREEEPVTPSTCVTIMDNERITQLTESRHANLRELKRELKGDLDWITLKAMEKDRTRRYETANGLAADVMRYLANEPVVARPPSATYRLRKLVRRNKITFAATMAVAVALILVTAVTLRERANTARQRDIAQAQRNLARLAVDKMFTQVAEQWLSQRTSLEPLQEQFLQDALDFYTQLADEETDDPDLLLETGNAYRRIAAIQFKVGKRRESEAAFKQAQGILEPLVADNPESARFLEALASTYHAYAFTLYFSDRRREARDQYQRAYDERKILVEKFPDVAEYRRDMALSLGGVASVLERPADRAAVYRQSLDIATSLPASVWHEGQYQLELGLLNFELTMQLRFAGDRSEESWQFFDRSQELYQQLVDEFPSNPTFRNELSWLHLEAGRHRRHGTLEAALKSFLKSIEISEQLVRESPAVPDYQYVVGLAHVGLANTYLQAGQRDDAVTASERAIEILTMLMKENPELRPQLYGDALTDACIVLVRARSDKSKEGEVAVLLEALVTVREVVGDTHPAVARILRDLGHLRAKAGDVEAADETFRE